MKFLVIIMLLTSCSSTSNRGTAKNAKKSEYLIQFNKLTSAMEENTQECLTHTQNILVKPIVEKEIDNKKFEFQFKNNRLKIETLKKYNPLKFDWVKIAQLKSLYLQFPYNQEIIQTHFDKSNNLKDCGNDFDNLNFLTALINSWEHDQKNSEIYKQTLNKYFAYLKDNDTPLISILILDHIVQLLHEKKLLNFKNENTYSQASLNMTETYTQVGKSVLLGLKEKNFEEIYKLDKKLLEKQKNFKRLIFDQISLLK